MDTSFYSSLLTKIIKRKSLFSLQRFIAIPAFSFLIEGGTFMSSQSISFKESQKGLAVRVLKAMPKDKITKVIPFNSEDVPKFLKSFCDWKKESRLK